MSNLAQMFKEGAKVVISPDQMRAWVMLPKPAKGVTYTPLAIAEWLAQNKVLYGVQDDLVRAAAKSTRYDDLLEVARGKTPVPATGGSYTLQIEKKPFTGLKGNSDGSLFYDDLSFLQEAQEGQILAEVSPATLGEEGMTVTGETLKPKEGDAGKTLAGNGFEVTDEGRYYRAPCLSHVSIVNDELIVTPLMKLDGVEENALLTEFEGNILVEGDVRANASLKAEGSIFVTGRVDAATLIAGRNVLLSGGMRVQNGFGHIEAKENVWGLCFEQANIKAGGNICANHLTGCEAQAGGRASILGGRGLISNTTLYAQDGVVAGNIGADRNDSSTVSCGMEAELIARFEDLEKKITRLGTDIQSLQQNIITIERINRTKADKGRNDPNYKAQVAKRDQSLSVQKILETERMRMKRMIDRFANANIVVRDMVQQGVTIVIDNCSLVVKTQVRKVKFKRFVDMIETITAAQ